MTAVKDEIMKKFCTDLTDEDLDVINNFSQKVLDEGCPEDQLVERLLSGLVQAIVTLHPELEDEEVVQISCDVGNALLDRLAERLGVFDEWCDEPEVDTELPPSLN